MDMRFFEIKNPWRTGAEIPAPTIRRETLDLLPGWLGNEEILVIHGVRRVGKSALLLAVIRELISRHGVRPSQVYFFDLDTLDCSDVLASPASLVDFIGMPRDRVFVFIDEVQRLESPGLFLKGIFDLGLPIKLFVAGSSSNTSRATSTATSIRSSVSID
jgi:hypothetical protein